MRRNLLIFTSLLTSVVSAGVAERCLGESPKATAKEILELADIDGGVIVHLGCGDGRLTAELGTAGNVVVHGLDADPSNVAAARKHIQSRGLYGDVSVDRLDGKSMPYADNLINLVVIGDASGIAADEITRVLCPGGVALTKRGGTWTKRVKPWPDEIDQWTHYLHGADGNPVANDTRVGPPRRYQWLCGPLWLRSHESDSSVRALVTAGGKLFYMVDEAPTSLLGENPLPDKWFLAARDAFNGTPLWKVPVKDWGWRAWKPSWFTCRPGDIPLNIQKRLVAVGDRVYVTLGYQAPVSELDAATGKTLRVFQGTERTGEILHAGDTLILTIIGENDQDRVAALDLKTGKIRWTSGDYGGTKTCYYRFRAMRGSVTPAHVDPTLNTATDGKIVAMLDGADVVALDFATGKELWRSEFPLVEADYNAGRIPAGKTLWRGTLIVSDGVVIHASPNQLAAFAADSGKMLWKQPKKYLQHLWFEWMDVFVIDGLVWTWSAELDRGKLVGGGGSAWPRTVNGYDLHTGKLKKQVPLGNIFKTHHHHRCYRNKATPRYILASRRGTEFVDLKDGEHTVDNWVRGTCHLGMMPANGLQYAPPHPCVCYMDEKLNGFNALAAEPARKKPKPPSKATPQLEKGPAFGKVKQGKPVAAADWPAFRSDTLRSGSVATKVPAKLKLRWREKIGDKLAPPIVVADRVYVPLVDEHAIVALDADSGKRLWQFTTGGRIDSSPTFHKGTLLFGSADGWAYCVRADDGQLVWRFRGAPEDRRIGAFGQLESAWPVHGSVLVVDDVAYLTAGRSSQLDGGIRLFALDAATGKVRNKKIVTGPFYEVDGLEQNYKLPMGALSDVLQSDGQQIFMRDQAFEKDLTDAELAARGPAFVRPKGSLLDDSYFKRIPWATGNSGFSRIGVRDDTAVYAVRMFDSLEGLNPKVFFVPGKKGYLLFAKSRTGKNVFSRRIPIRVNAMAVTDDVLFVAGYPDVVDPDDMLAAFEGRKGGVLAACDKTTGEILWQTKLPAPPVFHGIAAANGRLYVATQDGDVASFGK